MGLELDKLVGHLQVSSFFEVSRRLSAELGECCLRTQVNHRGRGSSEAGTGFRRRSGEHSGRARTECVGRLEGDEEGSRVLELHLII